MAAETDLVAAPVAPTTRSLLMWDDIFRRWVDLLFWWVPRTEETRPERAKESTPGASEQGASHVPEEAVEQQVPTGEAIVAETLPLSKG